MIVDVHAHCSAAKSAPPKKLQGTPDRALLNISDSADDVAERIRRMDEAGIDRQMLLPSGWTYSADEHTCVEATRVINEALATAVSRRPDRLSRYLCLPLPHMKASLEVLDREYGGAGVIGIAAYCSVLNTSIADEQFDPLFAALDKLGAVLFLHPIVNGICSPFVNDWGLAPAVGTSLEDAMAILHLIVRRMPSRYPNVKIIIPHLGGPIPMLLPRLDGQLPWAHPDLAEPPSQSARRFWYDTVAHGSVAALRCACEALGPERLLPGSDFPYVHSAGYADCVDYIRRAGLNEREADLILHRNAVELFQLERRDE